MIGIQLTQGKVALVDDEDFEWLSQWEWYALKNRGMFYAGRKVVGKNGERRVLFMHSVVMGKDRNMLTDHKNGNGLDNQKDNLRDCTKTQNMMNRKLNSNNKSGFKGVSDGQLTANFKAYISVNGRRIHLGYFDVAEDAARAYDKAAKTYFGEFARLNFNEAI